MAQYNFSIDDDLKDKVEKALIDSGLGGKPKFLEEMVMVYQTHLTSKQSTQIDMSAYQNANEQTKEAIKKSFMHILSTIDYNFSTLQQEKIYIEEQKQELNNQTVEIKAEIEKVKLEAHEEQKELNSKHELEKTALIEESEKLSIENGKIKELLNQTRKELESMSSIAKQTSSVMEENKELRADSIEIQKKHHLELETFKEQYTVEIDKLKVSHEALQKSMRTKDKELFEATHTLNRCKEDVEQYQEEQKQQQIKLDKKQKELEEVTSQYNQLLGKIEVLERLEKEHNEVDD